MDFTVQHESCVGIRGNSKIYTTYNDDFTIKQLYKKWYSGGFVPRVLTYNIDSSKPEFKPVVRIKKHKQMDRVVKIKVNGDRVIICGKNQKILLSDSTYSTSQNFQTGSLITIAGFQTDETKTICRKGGFTRENLIQNVEQYEKKIPYLYSIEVEYNHNFVLCAKRNTFNSVPQPIIIVKDSVGILADESEDSDDSPER